MFAGAAGGMLKTIKGQRAMMKYDENERKGEMNIVTANRFMVTVKGHGVEQETLVTFAEAVDFAVLEKN